MTELILHNYFRSSTSIRVRIALNLKQLEYHYVSYSLLQNEHQSNEYLALNPQGLVPALQLSPDKIVGQSLAIIEYLDETYPAPPLLPDDAWGRARVRAMALMIACDIHPLNNLRVLNALKSEHGADQNSITEWFSHWVHRTFSALETQLSTDPNTNDFCYGNSPTIADICLYAQALNNQRFEVDMSSYPTINRIVDNCDSLEAFASAHPSKQPDAF